MTTAPATTADAPDREHDQAGRVATGGREQSSRLAHLQEVLDHAAHFLPAQGPIKVFIHHNTLHAFEEQCFDDGVKAGNVFTFFRQHDPLPTEAMLQPSTLEEQFPREDIGQCIAFEVKAKASICLVSRTLRELTRGDNVEMRAAGGRRASR